MASTANEITSRGDLTARVADADDSTEVGRLGSAINTMLDRIQQAFGARLRSEQKVREFAADASHELRTPLTTIRGYAELYRQGALGPDQLPNAMRRIEQEAQRMSTLVAELLELARLDRTSSLDLTETDLAGVVRDAVADAVAVEPERPVRAEAPPRLVAVVDEPRIRQVLANLLGNVRAHTPVATPVAVRLGALDGDGTAGCCSRWPTPGPACPPRTPPGPSTGSTAPRTGRRRRRPAGHRRRAPRPPGVERSNGSGGGSGLGLSIVQAIARAHGGQATLESWPGRGTRVRIWLPAAVLTRELTHVSASSGLVRAGRLGQVVEQVVAPRAAPYTASAAPGRDERGEQHRRPRSRSGRRSTAGSWTAPGRCRTSGIPPRSSRWLPGDPSAPACRTRYSQIAL